MPVQSVLATWQQERCVSLYKGEKNNTGGYVYRAHESVAKERRMSQEKRKDAKELRSVIKRIEHGSRFLRTDEAMESVARAVKEISNTVNVLEGTPEYVER